jgi:hypothetical protein
MPPQQAYRLPDFVDQILRFRAHGSLFFLEFRIVDRRGT